MTVVDPSDPTVLAEETGTVILAGDDPSVLIRDLDEDSSVLLVDADPGVLFVSQETFTLTSQDAPVLITDATTGPQGPQGADGVTNLFISDTQPTGSLPAEYMWVQTSAGDLSIWIEDGS